MYYHQWSLSIIANEMTAVRVARSTLNIDLSRREALQSITTSGSATSPA